ncbi:MAG: hypothetical protein E2O84_02090 [Bacteroidetes bacterium]|nr:MAG: hypothetical protein E2O84_02090 [Bacteroidota bacterium]
MKTADVVKELAEAVQQLGVMVRREKGNFRGGYCIRDGEEILMLNKRHPSEVHLGVLAAALKDLPVDTVFLRPAVRRALEDAWIRSVQVELESEDGDG